MRLRSRGWVCLLPPLCVMDDVTTEECGSSVEPTLINTQGGQTFRPSAVAAVCAVAPCTAGHLTRQHCCRDTSLSQMSARLAKFSAAPIRIR